MSFVVRHKDTGFYLQGQDRWTNQLEAALRFNSGLRLVDYVEHRAINPAEQLEVIIFPAAGENGPALNPQAAH